MNHGRQRAGFLPGEMCLKAKGEVVSGGVGIKADVKKGNQAENENSGQNQAEPGS